MNKRNCIPRSSVVPSQSTLFDPWPKQQQEPYGNPAYEGVGYPAAGYGQRRREVVPLALPKVAAPQLTSNGWEGKVPQGTIVTVGTLNPNSDAFTRQQIAPLAGLGCACSKTDHRMRMGLLGLGAAQLSPVQEFANSIMNNVVSDSTVQNIVNKIIKDEKANAEAYALIQNIAKLQPNAPVLKKLRDDQQRAWGETNTAKFYAFLLPVVRERLVGKVTKPDYKYVKQGGTGGTFAKVAQYLQDKLVGDAAQQLIQQGYAIDSTGLAGLGSPAVIGGVVAVAVAAAILAYMGSNASELVASASRTYITSQCASGALDPASCKAALDASKSTKTNWEDVTKYAAFGIGGLVLLQVAASIRNAFSTR